MFPLRVPSLRSGFRLRTPAALTPARRLNFLLRRCHYVSVTSSFTSLRISPADSRCADARKTAQLFAASLPLCFRYEFLRFAQDFACGLPLRSRPQDGSTFCCVVAIMFPLRVPSLRSGFRLRTPAALTPARRLNFLLATQQSWPRCAWRFSWFCPG